MIVTEIRAFPVSSTVVMRSTLFALANLGATLQTYNEDSGVIVATVSRWLGLQKQEVVARVRSFEQTCQIELDAPDVEKARELLQLIATYVRDGGRVQANATMQWVDLQRQQANKARRQELGTKARNLLGGGSESNLPAVVEEGVNLPAVAAGDPAQPGPSLSAPVAIPDNPGVLVKNNRQMLLELKVDPQVFTDRTGFVTMCTVCYAPALRGSAFCPNCGRPLTLEAVQPELRGNAQKSARSGLTYGLIGLALNIVPLLVLVLPALLAEPATAGLLDRIRETLSPLTIALAAILGIAPAMVAGFLALRQGQRAAWFLNLPAVLEQNGRGQASLGTALGWLSIYLGVAWILLIVITLL
ncbi:MAG: hypothetical protein K1X50_05055 [Candidatus Promineofilum sp.]|nr:hypothetical protein [Promineifilum sp.]MCW5861964.1 zinc ribbon domain-containing protein [Anaerolineae bacterium]